MKKFIIFVLLVSLVAAVVCVSGLFKQQGVDNPKENVTDISESSPVEKEITLYFSSGDINTLVPEKRILKANDEKEFYILAVEALINGPEDKKNNLTIHPETVVNSVKLSGGTATVDFTGSLKDKNTGGSTREMMCIYSVVNTLCEFEGIDKVVFTINGKPASTFGQFDMSEPFEADKSLIKAK